MDINYILIWCVGLSCMFTIVRTIRDPFSHSKGWIPISLSGLAITGVAFMVVPAHAGFIGLGFWLLFGIIPAQGFRWMQHLLKKSEYQKVRRVSHWIRWLHPFTNWRERDDMLSAYALAHQGKLEQAHEILKQYESSNTRVGRDTILQLHIWNDDWESVREWIETNLSENAFARDPYMVFSYLRALGETGDLNKLVKVFKSYRKIIEKTRAISRLSYIILFAFCGYQKLVFRLIQGTKRILPQNTSELWLATVALVAGNAEEGQRRLKALAVSDNALTRATAQRRLSSPMANPLEILTDESRRILSQLEQEAHWEAELTRYKEQAKKQPYATYLIIGINLIIFAVEVGFGGSTDIATLLQLGALWPKIVLEGQWWRVLTASFLHYGWLHILLNMVCLYAMGPVVELIAGWKRYLLLYVSTGVGSMFTIVWLTTTGVLPRDIIYVGASGCIMGFVGIISSILLRLWREHRVHALSRRLIGLVLLLIVQTVMDWAIPEISFWTHFGGFVIGFIGASLIRTTTETIRTT